MTPNPTQGLWPEQIEQFGMGLSLEADDPAWEGAVCPICLSDFAVGEQVSPPHLLIPTPAQWLAFTHGPILHRRKQLSTTHSAQCSAGPHFTLTPIPCCRYANCAAYTSSTSSASSSASLSRAPALCAD